MNFAHGEETSESKLRIREAIGNKRFDEDKRITDIELKAQAGSLSRYSLKFDLSYSGPPVDNLSDPQMPNPDNRPRPNRTSLGGSMGLRFRVSPQDAIGLSTGLKWFTPVHQIRGDSAAKNSGDKNYEISDPRITYDRTYTAGVVQMRSGAKISTTTSDYYQDRGQTGSVGLTQGAKWVVFGSRWILGSVADLDTYFFDRAYEASDRKMSRYNLALIPSIEYKISDSFNLRTSVGWSFSNLRSDSSWADWDAVAPTARAGVGWAITRDIYVNPFLNFYTSNPAIRTTSLSMITAFSIF